MSVKWFTTSRSHGEATAYEPFRLIFTEKPKGIRFNAAMTKRLLAMKLHYLRIGIDQNRFLIQPVESSDNAFKLIANKNSGQICSAVIGDWAKEQGLIKTRLRGEWDEEAQGFVFDLAQVSPKEDEEEKDELEAAAGWLNGNR